MNAATQQRVLLRLSNTCAFDDRGIPRGRAGRAANGGRSPAGARARLKAPNPRFSGLVHSFPGVTALRPAYSVYASVYAVR